MLALKPALLTPEQYLAQEAASPERCEYYDGALVAMTGGSRRHNRISLNAASRLVQHLRGKPCQVGMADLKLSIARANSYVYPDVVVACSDQAHPADAAQSISEAQLVIEVLSPSTEMYDRREKFFTYKKLASLQEYALVSQDCQRVELFRRQGEVGWLCLVAEHSEEGEPCATVEFASVGLTLPLLELYEGTDALLHAPPFVSEVR
jgi:Uma2 family endonuclease